ncbi:hypothetical protein GCM10009119_05760 [Algoriphagus jejuensis]|uniref:Uncharacterized protein n=1 Tax=Algoriphagus jejuensis TaxID=419934 RepID=A0ABP3Y9N7_9BACT
MDRLNDFDKDILEQVLGYILILDDQVNCGKNFTLVAVYQEIKGGFTAITILSYQLTVLRTYSLTHFKLVYKQRKGLGHSIC